MNAMHLNAVFEWVVDETDLHLHLAIDTWF